LRTPEKERIQLVHALTMSLGLKWVEAIPSNEDDNDEVRMHRSSDPCRYVLGLPVTAPPEPSKAKPRRADHREFPTSVICCL
jgi:hypothetical protein